VLKVYSWRISNVFPALYGKVGVVFITWTHRYCFLIWSTRWYAHLKYGFSPLCVLSTVWFLSHIPQTCSSPLCVSSSAHYNCWLLLILYNFTFWSKRSNSHIFVQHSIVSNFGLISKKTQLISLQVWIMFKEVQIFDFWHLCSTV